MKILIADDHALFRDGLQRTDAPFIARVLHIAIGYRLVISVAELLYDNAIY